MSESSGLRLFIGAELPDEFLPVLTHAAHILGDHATSLRLTKQENLHLTLCFLGDLTPDKAEDACAWFSALEPLDTQNRLTRITGYGAFAGRDGLTVWAGLSVTPAIHGLATQLAQEARALGIPVERRTFVPHITLARSVTLRQPMEALASRLPLSVQAPLPHITLYRSEFTRTGMLYTKLVRIGV